MQRHATSFATSTALSLILTLGLSTASLAQDSADEAGDNGEVVVLDEITVLSAEEQLKQSLGVSVISAQDLERAPTGRDLSEMVRKMPGVNLSGNTASGQYGQSRQIDLRGMGPENTLILIDGKPVLSRNSQRMGRQGERDTRGDSNWIAPELIERIEVIRGPAAARYGSGAAGGVVNIITKRPDVANYSLSTFFEVPESSDEGGTRRVTATAAGPVNEVVSYRFNISGSWTDPDKADINEAAAQADAGTPASDIRAGREGVRTTNIGALVSAAVSEAHRLDFEASFSRQSNSFVGATLNGSIANPSAIVQNLINSNAETSRLDRTTLSATHVGTYDFGESNSYIQWERTSNRRPSEGLVRGDEGVFTSLNDLRTTQLDNLTAKTEWVLPLSFWVDQKLTVGAEYRGEFLRAPISADSMTGNGTNRMETHTLGIYLENNMLVTDKLTVTPGIRADYHSKYGLNASPSLNASYAVTDEITLKAGVARAFKSPNLYQLSPDWMWNSMGNGCPIWNPSNCIMRGNPDLKPEISINKEIGIAYQNDLGWAASITYFHNDYQNKIMAGEVFEGLNAAGQKIFNWENSGPATVSGLEGSVTVPVMENLTWTTNFTKILTSEREMMRRDAAGNFSTGKTQLSLVPQHTINTSLRWEAIEGLGLTVGATHYGKTEAATINVRGIEIAPEDRIARKAYTLVNISADYEVNDNVSFSAGVNNLFDKRLFATGGAVQSESANGSGTNASNANTFNEPGRSYWLSLKAKF
jgi:ferric enterobactin receptor